MLADTIKSRIKDAMKQKLHVDKEILRVVMGDIESQVSSIGKPLKDKEVEDIIYKRVKDSRKVIKMKGTEKMHAILSEEINVLYTLVPPLWTEEQIEHHLILHALPEIVQSKEAKDAMRFAMPVLKQAKAIVDGTDVLEVIIKIKKEHAGPKKEASEENLTGQL